MYEQFLSRQEQRWTKKTPAEELVLRKDGKEEEIKRVLKNIRGLKLQGRDLRLADFSKALLPNADLRKAQLQGADLSSAKLQGADLFGANLQGANLRKARLTWADLREVITGEFSQN